MAAAEADIEPQLRSPTTPNVSLSRVGSLFLDNSPTNADSNFYVLGSIGRLCNEVDDITLAENGETRPSETDSSSPPESKPITRVPTAFNRDTPVFSWEPRTTLNDGASLDSMLQKRKNPANSSLAPQSSSDPSEAEASEAPSVGQFRPGTDLIQCPVQGCERAFKWKKNLHHHIRDKHPTDMTGLSVLRVNPPQMGAVPSGYRLQNIAMAPASGKNVVQQEGEESLRCPECSKLFARKGDLVHHKRYHTRSNDRPYKCDQCGQGFIHHKDLARHMPRHTGQRSFQCPFPECNKNYTRKDNLNRHMRHDHGGLGASGEVWTGNDQQLSISQPESVLEVHIDPAIPVTHLAAIAEAAQNHAALQESSFQTPSQLHPLFHEPSTQTSLPYFQSQENTLLQESVVPSVPRNDSASSDASMNGHLQQSFRETTPSLGKRPADDLERLATGNKTKRKPKEKWAHRLGCPFRKCRSELFTTEHGYRVCETTPHEFIIRLIEHMKRNHDLYVCGECFLGFKTTEALALHKSCSMHCSKCYLAYPGSEAFTTHFSSCRAVEATTQEDIWQILYETLCGDGVRHNPSFDDDTPDGSATSRSNLIRMRLLEQQPSVPGQVASLVRQLATPVSGNGKAPPAELRADHRQQLEPAGAKHQQAAVFEIPIAALNQDLQLSIQRPALQYGSQNAQAYLANTEDGRALGERCWSTPALTKAQAIAQPAVMLFTSRTAEHHIIRKPHIHDLGWLEELDRFECDAESCGATIRLSPRHNHEHEVSFTEVSRLPSYTSNGCLPLMHQLGADMQCSRSRCPSLVTDKSDCTLEESAHDSVVPAFSRSTPVGPKEGRNDDTPYRWDTETSKACMRCGGFIVDAQNPYCSTCIRAHGGSD